MMIEPPRQFVGSAILEIDNCVFTAAKLFFADVLAGFVCQAFKFDLGGGIDVTLIKTREHRCGGNPIKTIVVVQDP